MPRVIAMMNQKGGVGKTTSAVNLAAALAASGQRVCLIDLDPQAHMTLHVGLDPDEIERYGRAVDAAVAYRSSGDDRAVEEKTLYEQSFIQCMNL